MSLDALGNVGTDPTIGLALLNLPVVDYMDPKDPNVYAASDEDAIALVTGHMGKHVQSEVDGTFYWDRIQLVES